MVGGGSLGCIARLIAFVLERVQIWVVLLRRSLLLVVVFSPSGAVASVGRDLARRLEGGVLAVWWRCGFLPRRLRGLHARSVAIRALLPRLVWFGWLGGCDGDRDPGSIEGKWWLRCCGGDGGGDGGAGLDAVVLTSGWIWMLGCLSLGRAVCWAVSFPWNKSAWALGSGFASLVFYFLSVFAFSFLLSVVVVVSGSVCRISIKSLNCCVKAVVEGLNRWSVLSGWFVANCTQSCAGFLPCDLLACAEVSGRCWDGPPNSSLLWLAPVPIIAIYVGHISATVQLIRPSCWIT